MGAPPFARVTLLKILENSDGQIIDEQGRCMSKAYKLYQTFRDTREDAFKQVVFDCRKSGLIEVLREGKKCFIIEITDDGRRYLESHRSFLQYPIVSPRISASHSDPFKAIEKALAEIRDMLEQNQSSIETEYALDEMEAISAENERLVIENESLRQELAKEQTRHLNLLEEVKSLRSKLADRNVQQSTSLRPADLKPEWREAARKALDQGWVIEFTSGGHIKWSPPNGRTPVISSNTPGDHRSVKNTLAELARAGLQLQL